MTAEPTIPGDARAGTVRHVVWDWNGTLFDDAAALIESTIEAFAAAGLPPITPERYRQRHTQPIDEFYDRLYGAPVPAELRRTLHEGFADAYRRRAPALRPAPGARTSLEHVARRGLSQSLLSMHPHERLVSLVDHFGFTARFLRVEGSRGTDSAGKSGSLARHLDYLELPGRAVLLIGDSIDDARAAAAVGARCVLLASGLHTTEALAAHAPVATSLPEAVRTGLADAEDGRAVHP